MAKSKSTRAPSGTRAKEAQARKILRDYKGPPPLMTKGTMFELDAAISADNFGVSRRTAFMFLTEPCSELIKRIRNDRESAVAAASMLDGFTRYRDCLGDLQSWMDEAQKRIGVALATREDMGEVLAEGKASTARANSAAEVAHA